MKKTILVVACVLALAACDKKKEVTAEPVVEVKATEPVAPAEPTPTVDQTIITWLRSRPHSIQICHDSLRGGMYIQYPPLPADADSNDPPFHDWIYIKELPMYYIAANNTWYLAEADINKAGFSQVYPDVTGLTCKTNGSRQT